MSGSSADYPSYGTLDELFGRADLVVQVQIGKSSHVDVLKPSNVPHDPVSNPADLSGQDNAKLPPIVTTVHEAQVDKVYKGSTKQGQTIQVKQLGGDYMGVTYRDDGTVALKPGATYLLFLAVYPDSPASLLNPVQGQYLVDGSGKLTQVGEVPFPVTAADVEARSTAANP